MAAPPLRDSGRRCFLSRQLNTDAAGQPRGKLQERRKRGTMTKNSTTLTRRIGQTTYKVRVFFREGDTETMEDKILRMIRNESVTDGPEYGTMNVPQMSRKPERSAL